MGRYVGGPAAVGGRAVHGDGQDVADGVVEARDVAFGGLLVNDVVGEDHLVGVFGLDDRGLELPGAERVRLRRMLDPQTPQALGRGDDRRPHHDPRLDDVVVADGVLEEHLAEESLVALEEGVLAFEAALWCLVPGGEPSDVDERAGADQAVVFAPQVAALVLDGFVGDLGVAGGQIAEDLDVVVGLGAHLTAPISFSLMRALSSDQVPSTWLTRSKTSS